MSDTQFKPHIPLLNLKRENLNKAGEFEGYGNVFDVIDSDGDIVLRGAFKPALELHKKNNTSPALLWSHDRNEPIGTWLEYYEDNHGLYVKGRLTLQTRRGAEAHALLTDGAGLGLSIGFMISSGGTEIKNGIRLIKSISRLPEVSVVALPSNQQSRITVSKATDKRTFEKQLRDVLGYSNREAKRLASCGFDRDDRASLINEIRGLRNDLRTRKPS